MGACAGSRATRDRRANRDMRQQIGFLMQLAVLVFLPMLILWQLTFSIRLIVMPVMTLAGIIVFWVGHKLRES